MATDLGVNYTRISAISRSGWQYRMKLLRQTTSKGLANPSYNAVFRAALVNDSVFAADWASMWDNISGYLSSRGITIQDYYAAGGGQDPVADLGNLLAAGAIPYNIWSGQAWEGMSKLQRKELRGLARRVRCRVELIFQQTHNAIDGANLVRKPLKVGGEGGKVGKGN
jgi:hypothetical protein